MFMLTAIIMLNPPHLTFLICNCHQTDPHKPKKVPHIFCTCSSQLSRTVILRCVGSDHRYNITWQKLHKMKKVWCSLGFVTLYRKIRILYLSDSHIYDLYPAASYPSLMTSLNTAVHEYEVYPSITLYWLLSHELYSQQSL